MRIKHLGRFLVCILLLNIGLNLVQAGETDEMLLKKVLAEALAKKNSDYELNTHHFLANGQPEFTNRLILEDSPYLLQHAHNPVNWYAWGDEAFAAARQQNKPIFLSIGYSTCYWCHVMERESFANKQIAQLLNEHFISIKVDREQRPDIDAVYMAAVTLISGSGGWPMSSFLTPEGKTFIGGGYFSAEKLTHLLEKIHSLWQQQPQLLIQQAEQVRLAVEKQFTNQQQAQAINTKTLTQATEQILSQYDQLNGGFGYQPKFPQEMWLHYLVEFSVRFDHPMALEVAEKSLQAMARSGIYDHISGGFHRYATDAQWRIPHFEKMLYNQAQLSQLYLRAYQLSGKSEYAGIAKATLDYVLSDLVSAEGGFYAAVDAENEAGEGAYFVWTVEEIRQVLPPKLAALAIDLYGVVEQGAFDGKNVLFLRQDLPAYAQQHDVPLAVLVQDVQAIKTQLQQVRAKRAPPFVDHKIITAWNAMMIRSLAIASDILREPRYLTAAQQAADLLWSSRDLKTQQLWRSRVNNTVSTPAQQEDYAYYAQALLRLYDVTGETRWLDRAQYIADRMLALFWDDLRGGFFMNMPSAMNSLMVKPKSIKDHEIASGNAVALQVLSQLSKRVNHPRYAQKAEQLLAVFSAQLVQSPTDYSYFLMAAGDFLFAELGAVQYAAKGAVRVTARRVDMQQQSQLEIVIDIQPGWHINAHQPLQEYLIATDVQLAKQGHGLQLGGVTYPEAMVKRLNFQREQLALYEGKIKITAPLLEVSSSVSNLPVVRVKLQACNNKICLPPEVLGITVN